MKLDHRTHMILENDCPYEAQDDGRFSIDNVRNVYVDEFDLQTSRNNVRTSCTGRLSSQWLKDFTDFFFRKERAFSMLLLC